MYSVFLGALWFARDQDGQPRALCLVSASAFKGHAARQTCKTPIRSVVHPLFTCRNLCFAPLQPCSQVLATAAEWCRSPVVSTVHAMRADVLATTAATVTCILAVTAWAQRARGADLSLTVCRPGLAP